ncbi:uncharacterized protein LOC143290781 [Babylonia areolata]|uniref:uncharacterized protein LOC143290781 n=1 Tax=Babylonia areolata TaxID=304850 RepID=UPI003FD6B72E
MDTDTDDDVPMKNAGAKATKARRLSPKSRERAGVKSLDLRRPVRPVDREKMRPWLKNHLDSGTVFGLKWLNKDEGTFQVSWRHASRLGWKLETDGDVFEKWARHTGIYKDGDEPEPKRWKANFRCAIHSLPDVRELTDPLERRGHNANRTYRFLQPDEIGAQVKRKPVPVERTVSPAPVEQLVFQEIEESEDSGSQHAESDDRNTDDDAQYREIYVIPQSDHDYAVRIERQHGEGSVTKILSEPGSGYVVIRTKKPSNLPTTLNEALDISQPSELARVVQKPRSPVTKVRKKESPVNKGSPVKKSLPVIRGSPVSKGNGRSKVTPKAAQSKRKPTGAKAGRGGEDASQTAVGKKPGFSAAAGNREDQTDSGTGSPCQTMGFEALLEAAKIARMDTLTSTMASSTTTVQASSGASTSASFSATRTKAAGGVRRTVPTVLPPAVSSQVSSAAESRVIHIHPDSTEATFSSRTSHTSVPTSVVFNFLQSLVSSSSVSDLPVSSAASSLPEVSVTWSTGLEEKDSSLSVPEESDVVSSSGSVGLTSAGESDLLNDVSPVENQTVTSAPVVSAAAAASCSFTNSFAPQNTPNVTHALLGSELPSKRTTLPSKSELKSEHSVSNVVVVKTDFDQPSVKTEPGVSDDGNKWEQVSFCDSSTVKVDRSSFPRSSEENQSSSRVDVVASLPDVSVSAAHSGKPADTNSSLVLSELDSDLASVLKSSPKSSAPVLNSVTSPAVSATPQTGSSTCQAPGTSVQVPASMAQAFNMGPVFVINPSIVLTMPQTTSSSSSTSQQDNTNVVTMPIDLQDLLNMCFSGGAQQIFQNADGALSVQSALEADQVNIPDSSVNDAVLLMSEHDGGVCDSAGLTPAGMVDSSAVSASASEDEVAAAQVSQGTSSVPRPL